MHGASAMLRLKSPKHKARGGRRTHVRRRARQPWIELFNATPRGAAIRAAVTATGKHCVAAAARGAFHSEVGDKALLRLFALCIFKELALLAAVSVDRHRLRVPASMRGNKFC